MKLGWTCVMLFCYYPPLAKGPLTGGQWMYVCVGSGATSRQVTLVIKLLFQNLGLI